MTAPLVQRLSLVVDATTGQTETRMEALSAASRDAGVAAERSAGQVAAAAERVAAAQLKRDDAAGRVRVAEQQLLEVQEKGSASASRLAAAEERLESARRNLAVASRQVETAQQAQVGAQDAAVNATVRATAAQEHAAVGADRFREQLGGLRTMVLGFGAFELGDWLRDSTQEFLEGARGAQGLALSMNATTAQGGQLSQLFASLGLEAADLLEIQAEFATKVGAGGQALHAFGADLQYNKDGTVNWATTLTGALEQLQKIPDATKRNQIGFQLFGEEGYKQLSRLLTSGMSVRQALDAIGTPFSDADVRAAQQYDRAMMGLSLASGNLGRTLARELVPFATQVVGGLDDLAKIMDAVPLPMLLTTAAAITLGRLGIDPLALAAARLSAVMGTGTGVVSRWGAATSFAFQNLSLGQVALTGAQAGFSTLGRGVRAVTGALGGPFGVAMIGAGVAMHYASEGSDRLADRAGKAALELQRAANAGTLTMVQESRTANQLEETAGYWERSAAYVKGHEAGLSGWQRTANGLLSPFQRLTMGFGDTADTARGFQLQIEEARKELGAFGVQQQDSQTTTKSLNDLIATGATSGAAFAGAVRTAAQAQADQTRTSDTATAAIAAYHATTDGASAAVLGLLNAQLSAKDAGYAFLQALDDLGTTTDDAKTRVDEVAQAHTRLQEAALRSGQAAGDAAVQAAQAAGQVVTPIVEAQIRAGAMLDDLRAKLNTPGLSEGARKDLQGLVDQLQAAKDKGNVQAIVTLTGAPAVQSQLATATADRTAQVTVETRNGPAVTNYLDGLARDRLVLLRVESRNGPAVDDYLETVRGRDRLALIRVESRNGPAVDRYLDEIAGRRRVAVIDTQARNAPGAGGGPFGAAGAGGRLLGGPVSVQVYPTVDAGGRLTPQAAAMTGRDIVGAIREYERRNGPGWRR